MQTAQKEITAKEAIDFGFSYFKDFLGLSLTAPRNHVLLEGVEYDDRKHEWLITIGFDAGRLKETQGPLGYGEKTKEPIREIREFYLNAENGELVRMAGI